MASRFPPDFNYQPPPRASYSQPLFLARAPPEQPSPDVLYSRSNSIPGIAEQYATRRPPDLHRSESFIESHINRSAELSQTDRRWQPEPKFEAIEPLSTTVKPLINIENARNKLRHFTLRYSKFYRPCSKPIEINSRKLINEIDEEEQCVSMPPIETFMGIPKLSRKKHFYKYLTVGDILCVQIVNRSENGFICVILCMDGGKRRDISDCEIKVFCPFSECKKVADKCANNDYLRVVVTSFNQLETKIIVSIKSEHLPSEFKSLFKMGVIQTEDLPVHYRRQVSMKSSNYDELLKTTLSFNNPGALIHLCSYLNLPMSKRVSLFSDMNNIQYPPEDYAIFLRKRQAEQWAKPSVQEGIRHLKNERYLEAHRNLNEALRIDPENIDALVARGCLFANTSSLTKALEDFEKAISIDPNHANAGKYLNETLLEIGKSREENGDYDRAFDSYKKACCLNVANNSAFDALKRISEQKGIKLKGFEFNNDYKIGDKKFAEISQKIDLLLGEKKKKKSRKKRRESSSDDSGSSATADSSSSQSSSSSSSDDDTSSSDDSKQKHKRKYSRKKKKHRSKSKKSKKSRNDKNRDTKRKSDHSPEMRTVKSHKITISDDDLKKRSRAPVTIERARKTSPKISFKLRKPDEDKKTVTPAKPFESPVKAAQAETVFFNWDTMRPVSVPMKPLPDKSKQVLVPRPPSPKKLYIPGSSKSRSRSRSQSRAGSRSRSRSRSRVRERRSRSRSRSPRRRSRSRSRSRRYRRSPSWSPVRRGRSFSPRGRSRGRGTFRGSFRGTRRPRRAGGRRGGGRAYDQSPVISRAGDAPSDRDKEKKSTAEAKRIETMILEGEKGQ